MELNYLLKILLFKINHNDLKYFIYFKNLNFKFVNFKLFEIKYIFYILLFWVPRYRYGFDNLLLPGNKAFYSQDT
jgi:hypothetical protein